MPSARLPSVMGTLTEAPMRDDLICACTILIGGRGGGKTEREKVDEI